MDIPTELVTNWKQEGYTHLHLGGVGLILTLHGRKGLPDTRFKQYQHAVIGTILTTLHSGSVLLTFYQNFNMSIEDPNLPTTLKVQIQLQGAEQTSTSKIATLHHQIVSSYWPRVESSNLWFSSEGYPVYPDKVNGHFLWDVPEAHMCNPDCPCLDDTDDDEDFETLRRRRRRKKKPYIPKTSRRPYPSGPPDDPESEQPLPIYKQALNQIEKESSSKPVPVQPQIKSCLMFSSSSQSYQESFPPLKRHTDPQTKVISQPYVQSPITTSGAPEAPKQYEAVLNWQTQNASAQNQALHHICKKIDKVASQVQPQTKVYPPLIRPAHLNNLLQTQSLNMQTFTPIVGESTDDNNDDQGSQTEPVPPIPLVSEKSSKPSSSPWFTFDDIPRHKYQAQHQEFAAWIDVQMTRLHAQSQNVLREFCSRSLDHYEIGLKVYRQLQLIQTTIPIALAIIYEQFIGEPAASTEAS
ncbi:hypothetical protein KPL70_011687 [Citrus sinensis]|nr:hypothetical protein KPL70_011687 [Citrus sinensis]